VHSVFGPASNEYYFSAKKTIFALHQCDELGREEIFVYAQAHKFMEVTIGLSLLCSLPANVIELGLVDSIGEIPN
jgi:hypothetical protein